MSDAAAIRARHLDKRFGSVHAVRQLSLDIPRHSIFGFLGPNGCGKSTTIRMLCGLLLPSGGEIEVLGYAVPKQAEALKRKVGYMTQKFSLYEDLTALENLRFMGGIQGLNATLARERIAAALDRFRLQPLGRRLAGTLSGGQKQRLALAVATLHRPQLLFLDEPTSAVDPDNRRAFWETLFDLVAEGTTILVSTHYMDEAERCHGLAILDRGELVAMGEPAQLAANIDVQVIVTLCERPRQLRRALEVLPWVRSIAQIGRELRVLVDRSATDAEQRIARVAEQAGLPMVHSHFADANLEDVFVVATRGRRGRAPQ